MITIERHPFFITLELYQGSLGKFSTLCFRHIQDNIPQCLLLSYDVVLVMNLEKNNFWSGNMEMLWNLMSLISNWNRS